MKREPVKRYLSILISLVMLVSTFSTSVIADDGLFTDEESLVLSGEEITACEDGQDALPSYELAAPDEGAEGDGEAAIADIGESYEDTEVFFDYDALPEDEDPSVFGGEGSVLPEESTPDYEIAVEEAQEYAVFEEDFSEAEEDDAEDEEPRDDAIMEWAQTVDGVDIVVRAAEGAFPDDAVLSCETLSEEQQQAAAEIAAELREENTHEVLSYCFLVRMLDENGQPLSACEGEEAELSFGIDKVAEASLEGRIYQLELDESGSVAQLFEMTAIVDEAAQYVTTYTPVLSAYMLELSWEEQTDALMDSLPEISAETADPLADGGSVISMVQGEVKRNFAPDGAKCISADPSIAWVDNSGSLNALKTGSTEITVQTEEKGEETNSRTYTVKVAPYEDGSEIAGSLKLLTRFNDSMEFYDGHVYLLFTSYQDDLVLRVDDLYGGYEISDQYYADIRENAANGSNHSGSDAQKYFTFVNGMNSVTLDRGEIVTIGMYRGFDLSVPDAALGCVLNSSGLTELEKEGKSAIIRMILDFVTTRNISEDEALAKFNETLDSIGENYNKLLDGYVSGGVCFNRELYNQKLEWDQYENVTYELEITRDQLDRMMEAYRGNLNRFSLISNSCATLAVKAWNAAVGSRDGEDTAYKLSAEGEGILSYMDAPKGVRDNMLARLPGCYLNNSAGVAEPGAGYEDETGWVYVSKPKDVGSISYEFADSFIKVDEERTKMASLLNAARAGSSVHLTSAGQQVDVTVAAAPSGDGITVEGLEFKVGEQMLSLDGSNLPESGLWLMMKLENPEEGQKYYVTDDEGRACASVYEEGWIHFFVGELPSSFRIVSSGDRVVNLLSTAITCADDAKVETLVYYLQEEAIPLAQQAELTSGTEVYVKSIFAEDEDEYLLKDIRLNGISLFDDAHYHEEEAAWAFLMPEGCGKLSILYAKACVRAMSEQPVQLFAKDVIEASACAEFVSDESGLSADHLRWRIVSESGEGIFTSADEGFRKLEAQKAGTALLWAGADSNENIGVLVSAEVFEDREDMVRVTFGEENMDNILITGRHPDGTVREIAFSGDLVRKGSALTITPIHPMPSVISEILVNGEPVQCGETITAEEDVEIQVYFREAVVKGMPDTITLTDKGQSYQLNASVQYSSILYRWFPVFDPSLRYESSDPLVKVDGKGLITVAGEIPPEGKYVTVTAYAGSGNDQVYASSKVIVGNYQGTKIVGRLTIHARAITPDELTPHGSINFQTYEDVDLDVSYYCYYKPTEAYNALMQDYRDHPEKYSSDPALFNEDLNLVMPNREAYFEEIFGGIKSEPSKISLHRGESISFTSYCYDDYDDLTRFLNTIENSELSESNASIRALTDQIKSYLSDGEIDEVQAFDALVDVIGLLRAEYARTGRNLADSPAEGGLTVNREMYNQFRRRDTQEPNFYYTVEITADELARLKHYLADPENNYYSIFMKNCGSAAIDAWNATLADRPELHITSSGLLGMGADPEALYFNLLAMTLDFDLDGKGGINFYPRTVSFAPEAADEQGDSQKPSDGQDGGHKDIPSAAGADKEKQEAAAAEQQRARLLKEAEANAKAALRQSLKLSQKGNKLSVSWSKADMADGYEIYAAYSNKKFGAPAVVVTSNTKTSATLKKLGGKKLNTKKIFKVYVTAYKLLDGKRVPLAKTVTGYVAGAKNKSYTNPKRITVSKKSYELENKAKTISAKVKMASSGKKHLPKKYSAKFRYVSSDESVVKVDKKGKITKTGVGTAIIYVYSINGLCRQIKVTAK